MPSRGGVTPLLPNPKNIRIRFQFVLMGHSQEAMSHHYDNPTLEEQKLRLIESLKILQ
ncbi:hypothetical protein [Entomospira culicis]|uniref:hypothetical protein n=1 Tax=Entomospira culicis TaxID=2719989 RepID=UPI001694F9EF|nr:hypothetical protein [Entomospira culicis]NIZ19078.1 hypothetical protein [Entomospira culicis]